MLAKSTPTVTNYYHQLNNLRKQEDKLFQLALTNPQESHLAQFESIWNTRNEVYTQMEDAITPMPIEPVQVTETQEPITYTAEELKAIPKMDMHCGELVGKLFYSLDNRPQLAKKFKLPATVIERYKLTPRQVAILEGKIRLAPQSVPTTNQREDEPLCYDGMYSDRCSENYAYTARDIVMGQY
jgi:hypothetical protein